MLSHACLRANVIACTSRAICTTSTRCKVKTQKHKATRFHDKPLTYQQAMKAEHVGVRSSWFSWHTHNLMGFEQDQPNMAVQDELIQRFMQGTFAPRLIQDHVIIKRRVNVVYIAAIISVERLPVQSVYWLTGYTEEMLSLILKQPVKLELSTVGHKDEMTFTHI